MRSTRGAARRFGKAVPTAVELAEKISRGRRAATRRGERERRQRGRGGVQERLGRPGGTPSSGVEQPAGGNSGGGDGAELRRGGRRKKGWRVLSVICEKSRGSEVN